MAAPIRVDTRNDDGKDGDPPSPTPECIRTSFPKHKIQILLLENISQTAIDAFVQEGFQVEAYPKLSNEELKAKIKTAHVVGVRSKTKLTKDVLSAAERLLCIGTFCIGTDQTDLVYAAERGWPVFNAPFANTRSVAEMVLAEAIGLARQLGDRSSECHRGEWKKVSAGCYEVRGKTMGIIGYGHVGSQLSVLAEAMGMRVIFYDIITKLPLGSARPCQTMNDLLAQSDFVSLHVPGTRETDNLLSEKQIQRMKRGSYLINASRGPVVDVEAAARALKSGHLAGAAFDVFPVEPASGEPFVSPLQGCPNTILTPHIGGSTEEAQAAIGIEVSSKLISYINTGSTQGAVNFPELALPDDPSTHRILNVHRNQPGVLKNINNILSSYNVTAQALRTSGDIGYLIVDLDKAVSKEVKKQVAELPSSLRTRILF